MTPDPICQDPLSTDRDFPAASASVTIQSGGQRLLGYLLMAQGAGPHPTVLLLHGFPGYERNLDLAHVVRRAGWNAVVFHYRGCWGSQGTYAFAHVLEDVHAALARLRALDASYRIDAGKIALVGHSLGGWAALMAAARDNEVFNVASIAGFNLGGLARQIDNTPKGLETTVQVLEAEGLEPLSTSAQALAKELAQHGATWDLIDCATHLAKKRVLLVAASEDAVAPPHVHHHPLAAALQTHTNAFLDVLIEADHGFSAKRIALSRVLLDWLSAAP